MAESGRGFNAPSRFLLFRIFFTHPTVVSLQFTGKVCILAVEKRKDYGRS